MNFTLPGEAGYEALTLELAARWGADFIRDSDGTRLSGELLASGYGIYSTICPVRDHNEWIRAHARARQQTFLSGAPRLATGETLTIRPLDGFFGDQFEINDAPDAMRYWQVYDRTADAELPRGSWRYDPASGEVTIDARPWRQYSVSFLVWRVWEEISMYNHVTNGWDQERLMQLNPYDAEARLYLKAWMDRWCDAHPRTGVVRFTSLFYNFAWIWGSSERNRNLFADWASYDFTVCPAALDDFEREYGYALRAEDFVRRGRYNATHRVPNRKKLDWMEFIARFVRGAARELVDVVHAHGKRAYVFYDDSWLGLEPYNGKFREFGFDGLIKCVFSGYEARLCAEVPVETREIRFHPYLFPVGLGGAPTFSPGGKPGEDALRYWVSVRRALLRVKIERCGLGGYLHLARGYPGFVQAMDRILAEFRAISELHDGGAPYILAPRVAVLTAWGALRSWTLSGHFHETSEHALVHVLESLSGLPFDVRFLSFDDLRDGVPKDVGAILCAGAAGDAWSGGERWGDPRFVENLTAWVHSGGALIGFGEPSAHPGGHTFLRMAHVFGADIDDGEYACHGKWSFDLDEEPGLVPDCYAVPGRGDVVLIGGATRALAEKDGVATLTSNRFGLGMGAYCAGFVHGPGSARFLQNLILYATGERLSPCGVTDNPLVECGWYPASGKLAFVNNSASRQTAACVIDGRRYCAELEPDGMVVLGVGEEGCLVDLIGLPA